jgi:hypothetical protein
MSWREYLNVGQLFLGNKSIPVKSYDVEFTVGTEAANVINVAIQLNDPEGKALEEVGVLDFYLADDAAGLTPSTTAPTGGIAIGTDGALIESVDNLSGTMISEADGDIDIDITDTGTPTFYLVCRLPSGGLAISPAITFA